MNKPKKDDIFRIIGKTIIMCVIILSIGIGMANILLFDTFPSSFH